MIIGPNRTPGRVYSYHNLSKHQKNLYLHRIQVEPFALTDSGNEVHEFVSEEDRQRSEGTYVVVPQPPSLNHLLSNDIASSVQHACSRTLIQHRSSLQSRTRISVSCQSAIRSHRNVLVSFQQRRHDQSRICSGLECDGDSGHVDVGAGSRRCEIKTVNGHF